MEYLETVWHWLSQENNQDIIETLAIIGGGMTFVLSVTWKFYLHFSKKREKITEQIPTPNIISSYCVVAASGNILPTASAGGIAFGAASNITVNNTVINGITLKCSGPII